LKKAAQKLLVRWVMGVVTDNAHDPGAKRVFLLLFVHKKKPSSLGLSQTANTSPA
jgi:hypothetical protein